MREGISVEVSAADRARLEAVVADRNSPQKHVWRARIVLGTADGLGTGEIMRRTGKSKPCVWPGFAVCGQRLEITVRFQDVTKGPVKACAYRRSGLGRER